MTVESTGKRRNRYQKSKQILTPPAPAQAPVLYVHPAKQGIDFKADNPDLGRPYGLFPLGLPALINELRPIGIVEMVRTGVVAMGRGTRILDTDYEPPVAVANGATGRYSV